MKKTVKNGCVSDSINDTELVKENASNCSLNNLLTLDRNELEKVEDSFQAYLVNDANFTSEEEYPIIPNEIISEKLPKKIIPFNKAITYQGDLSDSFICFFSPDKTFERVRRNPKRYLSFFKRTAGIIGFDYSVHSDMQVVKQKSQINDNLSLTYFFGKNGIPIFPNLRCGIDELQPEFFQALPKNSYYAIGTHGFIKKKHQQYEWYCFIKDVIENLKPKGLIVYGTLNSPMFDEFKKQTNFYFYDAWIKQRSKEVKKHGK